MDILKLSGRKKDTARVIDVTPSWGEVGNLFCSLAFGGEIKAAEAMKSEAAKAFALAEALTKVHNSLSDEQKTLIAQVVAVELKKQGY